MPEQRIKTIIADGDETASGVLTQLLHSCCSEIDIVCNCNSLQQTLCSIEEFNPALIFTETEFPDGTGIDLLCNYPGRDFRVVFVTSHHNHAISAFRYSASDYLLKPVKEEELISSVRRVKTELAGYNSMAGLQNLIGDLNKKNELPGTLIVNNSKGFTVLKTDDIVFLEADGYCTNFYLTGKTKISSARNLKYYSCLLPPSVFMRVHHSFIINLSHVKGYNSDDNILLTENYSCSLSTAHKNVFLACFRNKKH